jgi:hypothetical protein
VTSASTSPLPRHADLDQPGPRPANAAPRARTRPDRRTSDPAAPLVAAAIRRHRPVPSATSERPCGPRCRTPRRRTSSPRTRNAVTLATVRRRQGKSWTALNSGVNVLRGRRGFLPMPSMVSILPGLTAPQISDVRQTGSGPPGRCPGQSRTRSLVCWLRWADLQDDVKDHVGELWCRRCGGQQQPEPQRSDEQVLQ